MLFLPDVISPLYQKCTRMPYGLIVIHTFNFVYDLLHRVLVFLVYVPPKMYSNRGNKVLKLVIVGDCYTGKTTLLRKYAGSYDVGSKTDVVDKVIHVKGNRVHLQIHDTMGQERYRSLTSSYYRGSHGCIICFDEENESSFHNVRNWLEDIKTYTGEDIPRVLICMQRRDLIDTSASAQEKLSAGKRTLEEMRNFADHYKLILLCVELDSCSSAEIEAVFETITDKVLQHYESRYVITHSSENIQLASENHGNGTAENKKCSC